MGYYFKDQLFIMYVGHVVPVVHVVYVVHALQQCVLKLTGIHVFPCSHRLHIST